MGKLAARTKAVIWGLYGSVEIVVIADAQSMLLVLFGGGCGLLCAFACAA